MPGIRLHHEVLRNTTVAVECFRAYTGPYECPMCHVTHHFKTVHLTLDNEGDVTVSKGVWNDLKDVPSLPFTYADDIKKPPTLIVPMHPTEEKVRAEIHAHPFEGRR